MACMLARSYGDSALVARSVVLLCVEAFSENGVSGRSEVVMVK